MALTSVYYDGPVTEVSRAKSRAGAPDYGVYGPEDFEVIPHPTIPYAVIVKAGRAHGWGVTDEATEDQVVQCESSALNAQWDLIAVRRNWQPALGGPSELVAIRGGGTPEIPAERKVVPGVEDDQPLALVRWKSGLSAAFEIIDLRIWPGTGGAVAKHDLVRSYATSVGTRLWIGGIDWVRSLGDNDTPQWESADPIEVSADIATFGTGWAPTNSGAHKPRLRMVGNMVHMYGAVTQGSSAGVASILTIPAAFRPVNANSTFIGSGVTSKGVAYQLTLGNGLVAIDSGYITGSFLVGSVVPVVASWPIS